MIDLLKSSDLIGRVSNRPRASEDMIVSNPELANQERKAAEGLCACGLYRKEYCRAWPACVPL